MRNGFSLVFAILCIAACAPPQETETPTSTPTPAAGWLASDADSLRRQLDPHLRGLDVAMMEIGYRYGELIVAVRGREWPYAQYQAEKIALSLRLAVERRPARAASAAPFRDQTNGLIEILKTRDASRADSAMNALHAGCLTCHAAENVPHFNAVIERIRARSR